MKLFVAHTIVSLALLSIPSSLLAQEGGYDITKRLSCVLDGESLFLERNGERITTRVKKRILKRLRQKIQDTDSRKRRKNLRAKRRDVKNCGATEDNSGGDSGSGGGSGSRCPNGFAKQIDVFGVKICASSRVPDAKMLHAASIMAEYLDNDEDGEADDPHLIATLQSKGALLEMFKNQNELDNSDVSIPNGVISQPLFANETFPGQMAEGVFDFSLEEILHLISSAGLHYAYPEDLGEDPGSRMTDAMDLARGGRFITLPDTYPDSAWYTYDDRTCEYICMASEYFYWALTSWLGAQDIPGRLEEIDNEWRPNTAAKLQAQDPAIVEILTDPNLKLPSVLPDGNYAGGSFSITRL